MYLRYVCSAILRCSMSTCSNMLRIVSDTFTSTEHVQGPMERDLGFTLKASTFVFVSILVSRHFLRFFNSGDDILIGSLSVTKNLLLGLSLNRTTKVLIQIVHSKLIMQKDLQFLL